MMRLCFFLCLCFFGVEGSAQLDALRNAFFAAKGSEGIKKFNSIAENTPQQSAVERAYQGVAAAMRAEVQSSVSDKLKSFSDGKELIESSVKLDFYNPEIRFLRFSVQSQVPFFLGYGSEKDKDIEVIAYALEHRSIDSTSDFWQRALRWLEEYGDLNNDQLKKIRNYILQ